MIYGGGLYFPVICFDFIFEIFQLPEQFRIKNKTFLDRLEHADY
tara:strand:+ start:672 stop:803 length:132 start_codon:yes stop_codon:yes gene_type:complete